MKKMLSIISIVAISAMALLTGCDPNDNPEAVARISKSVGITAGYVTQNSNIDEEVKQHVVEILNFVSKSVVTTGSVSDVWKPIIEEEVTKLVQAGKIKDIQASIIKATLNIAADGLDYLFVRHPNWKSSSEAVAYTIKSFNEGFTSVVNMTKTTLLAAGSPSENPDIDQEAYEYLEARYASEILKISIK